MAKQNKQNSKNSSKSAGNGNDNKKDNRIKNILLYLCDPDEYESIISQEDKEKIVRAFWELIEGHQVNGTTISRKKEAINNIDGSLKEIRKELGGFPKETDNHNFFYENHLPLIWRGEGINTLSQAQKLEYKKAMILYGPPGTGKTYSARELAKEIIARHEIRKCIKGNLKNLPTLLQKLSNFDKNYGDRISYLQFHINYNYEDFIAGQTIEAGNVKTKKGFIFDVIRNANAAIAVNEENPAPYVVILDEINRTDISRVFGELFTAIEKRGEDVILPLQDPYFIYNKKLILNIPKNIYFIGTMNEIDFSLERVDFALRRRFVWELMGYKKDVLETIITDSLKDRNEVDAELIGSYCEECTSLNEKVDERMGESYRIGHAFFAEIANIYKELGDDCKKRWEKAKEILWQISIKPTLDAYCGSMEGSIKDDALNEFDVAFFGKKEKDGNS